MLQLKYALRMEWRALSMTTCCQRTPSSFAKRKKVVVQTQFVVYDYIIKRGTQDGLPPDSLIKLKVTKSKLMEVAKHLNPSTGIRKRNFERIGM
jgi:hypothetical protein